jgi:hypothetical protein
MIKYKENRIQIPFQKMDEFLHRKKNNCSLKRLKNQWEVFLSTHRSTKKKRSFGLHYVTSLWDQHPRNNVAEISSRKSKMCTQTVQDDHGSFVSFKKEKLENFNFLIRAKLVDFVGETRILNSKIQRLLKISKQHLGLENFFQIQLLNNTIFFSWIADVLSEQIYPYLTRNQSFLNSFPFRFVFRSAWRKNSKLEIRNSGFCFSFKFRDFFLLKWYKKKIQDWSQKILAKIAKIKEISTHKNGNQFFSEIHISYFDKDKNNYNNFNQDQIDKDRVIQKKHLFSRKMNTFSYLITGKIPNIVMSGMDPIQPVEQRYLTPFKNVMVKSKAITQVDLIQKLNPIIRNWDTSVLHNIKKRKLLKLNLLLSHMLWHWGIARHTKQKAKWIRNRYWSINPVIQSLNKSQ